MTSLGAAVNDAMFDRLATILPAVKVRYKGQQADNAEYILFLDDDERKANIWTDKDGDANDWALVLQLWSKSARTNLVRAKTIIDSLNSSPLTIAGFDYYRQEVEQNQSMPKLTSDGQSNEYARVLRIRFFYGPSA